MDLLEPLHSLLVHCIIEDFLIMLASVSRSILSYATWMYWPTKLGDVANRICIILIAIAWLPTMLFEIGQVPIEVFTLSLPVRNAIQLVVVIYTAILIRKVIFKRLNPDMWILIGIAAVMIDSIMQILYIQRWPNQFGTSDCIRRILLIQIIGFSLWTAEKGDYHFVTTVESKIKQD